MISATIPAVVRLWTSTVLNATARASAICAIVLGSLLATSPASAQVVTFEVGTVEVLPGDTGVQVPIFVSANDDITGFDLGLSYEDTRLDLVEVTLEGGVLEGRVLELFEDNVPLPGNVTISAILDSVAPYNPVVEEGDGQLLLSLVFDVNAFQFAGTEIPIEFTNGLGDPPVFNEVVVEGVVETEVDYFDGGVNIVSDDHLMIKDSTAVVGTADHKVKINGFNVENLHGFSFGITFDPTHLAATSFDLEGTITESVGAEFSAEVIDNVEGTAVYGVLLDYLPPFDGQTIAASGIVLEFAEIGFDVLETALGVPSTQITLTDGIGSPPIDNIFVLQGQVAVNPVLVNGTLNLLSPIPFMRGEINGDNFLDVADPIAALSFMFKAGPGPECLKAVDVNDDGMLTVADPIYLLSYLFEDGPEPPAPFPEVGFDPTPDDLFCFETFD